MRIRTHNIDGKPRRWQAAPPVAILVLVAVLWPDRAEAYIDPGTGSMIFQAALAAILGLGLVLRNLRARLWALLKRLAGSKKDT